MPVRGGHNKAAEKRMSRGETPTRVRQMPTNRRAPF